MGNPVNTSASDRQGVPATSAALLARLVPNAFGVALGTVVGALLAIGTVVLVVRAGDVVGPHLELLSLFLPGYHVSATGAVIGAAYGFVIGYFVGFAFAVVRNVAMAVYLRFAWSRLQHHVASDLLDRVS